MAIRVLRLILKFGLPVLALGLIGWGVYLLNPLAVPIVLGSLLWVDFWVGDMRGKDDGK